MRYMKTTILSGVAAILAMASVGISADPTTAPSGNTGSITGKVNGQDAKAVSGAMVKVAPANQTKKTADDPAKKADKGMTATTDENGQFRIDNIPPGSYTVTATVKGVSRGKTNATVTAGGTFDTTITMQPIKKKA